MKKVEEIEQEEDEAVDSSFHPEDFVPPHNKEGSATKEDGSSRYLPCHYFDYIGGTSTG